MRQQIKFQVALGCPKHGQERADYFFSTTVKSRKQLRLRFVKDVHLVLRQKEMELERVIKELEALVITAALLAEEDPPESPAQSAPILATTRPRMNELEELAAYYPFAERSRKTEK